MLLELRAENYAVIDRAVATFGLGLNLLTGETGAGKSILIDALALLLGGKASPDVVRHGADKAVVGCVFELTPGAAAILEANGIDSESDHILLRREIVANGKGRVFVNNQPATVAVLKQLAPHLAGIHAQNESLVSFDAGVRRDLLDNYANTQLGPVGTGFDKWKLVKDRIAELEQGEQDRLKLVDLWMFQRREIEDAKIQPGEDERLETQKRVLANAESVPGLPQGTPRP